MTIIINIKNALAELFHKRRITSIIKHYTLGVYWQI